MRVRERRRPAAVLLALAAATGVLTVPVPARADGGWGTAGAQYSGGILCQLTGATRVPMARWAVGGGQAFATRDVVGTPAGDGPAPVGDALTSLPAATGGPDGLPAAAVPALAWLISRHGNGSAAEVAEVSADVAAATGEGTSQAACLGQQGTSAAAAAALRAEADRYAGPYRLAVTAPAPAAPGQPAQIGVQVLAASGAAVPGVPVHLDSAAGSVDATTDAQGTAAPTLTVPAVRQTAVTVSADVVTGLLATSASSPGAVTAAPPTTVTAATTVTADLTPHPALTVGVGAGLVAARTTASLTPQVTGTAGFSGTGTVTLAGPATPGADGSCTSLPASAFAAAPNVLTSSFSVTGDGPVPPVPTPPLAAGCYVAGGTVSIAGPGAPAAAGAPFTPAAILRSIDVTVRRAPAPVLALPGTWTASVAAEAPGASVSTTAVLLGPRAPVNGRCDAVTWAGAPRAGVATATADDAAGTTVLRTPAVTALGCYALQRHTTVTQDGRTLALDADAGSPGSTTLVVRPTLTLTDDSYDTVQGRPMAGHLQVTGTYRFPGTITVRLRVTRPRFDGCRSVTFPAEPAPEPASTARTAGDGAVAFRTPVPRTNDCYAVDAVLRMDDAPAVQVGAASSASASTFLAGRPDRPTALIEPRHPAGGGGLRVWIGLGVAALLVLATAFAVVARVALRRRFAAASEWDLVPTD